MFSLFEMYFNSRQQESSRHMKRWYDRISFFTSRTTRTCHDRPMGKTRKKSAIDRQYLTLIEECIISISRGGTAPERDKLIATWKDGSRLKSSSRPTKARRMIESLLSEAESDKERKSNLKSISWVVWKAKLQFLLGYVLPSYLRFDASLN